jgi:Ca2+-binding RTX toxin-like protein
MAGLSEAGLSDWGNSTHAQFVAFPSSFQALAIDTDADPDKPVILAFTAPPPICRGKPATVFGGSRNDVLAGTSGRVVIAGLDGNDRINGGGGKDVVCGGAGTDKLKGGAAKDTLLGQSGRDLLAGGGGTGDVCKGGPGKDTVKASCEKGKA